MANPFFFEISMILGITVLISAIMYMLKQPLIIGYIISGILVSPYFLNLLQSQDTIHAFGQFGIAILLFVVGLNLNPRTIKEVGKTSVITGIGQIIFTFAFGIAITSALGFALIDAAYIAIALTFSSTIIILKLLSDKKELHTLYGKIATGFLIVQDLVVVTIMLFITTISRSDFTVSVLAFTIFELIGVFVLLFGLTKVLVPFIDKHIQEIHEFAVLSALAWCFALGSLFYYLGFSLEVGALFAGIVLANSTLRYELSVKIKPIRDFFLVMFFIVLGSTMVLENVLMLWRPALILSIFVLIGNPLIVLVLMYKLGYTTKTGFKAGLTVAQISEFSIILVGLGINYSHIEQDILSLITIVGLITIGLSSYLILYSDRIFMHLAPWLRKLFPTAHHGRKTKPTEKIVVFGYNQMGKNIVAALRRKRRKCLVIDNNPETVEQLSKRNISTHFGEFENPETLDDLEITKIQLFISVISRYESNAFILHRVRERNPKAIVIVVAQTAEQAISFYEMGASYVILLDRLGATHISTILNEKGVDVEKYIQDKASHIKKLQRQLRKNQQAASRAKAKKK